MIDLSTEELSHLASRLGVPVAPWLRASGALSDDVASVVERSLLARKLLTRRDGEVVVNDAVAMLLDIVARPGLWIEIDRPSGVTTTIVAVPDVAIGAVTLEPGVHRLTPFATVDLLDALCAEIGASGDEPDESWTVPSPDLAACLADPAPADAIERLSLALAGADIGPFSQGRGGLAGSMTIRHAPSAHQILGGDLRWMAHPDGRCWILPTDEAIASAEAVAVRLVGRKGLASALLDYLPSVAEPELTA